MTSTLGAAYDRAVRMLFKPFDLGKWFFLGLIIFLERLVEGGGGAGNIGNLFRGSGSSPGSGSGFPTPQEIVWKVDEATTWLHDHLDLILAIGIPGLLLLTFIVIAIVWVGSRGQMMFIRAVALDDVELVEHWSATRRVANSLFKFRLLLVVVNLVISLSATAAMAAIVWGLLREGSTELGEYLLRILPVAGFAFVAVLILGLVASMLRNFVAPLMYKFGEDCTIAWKRFWGIARENVGGIVVFLLIRFCFEIGAAILALLVTLLTCCIGVLPVVHQMLMAPYYVFDRAWSLYALGALGPEYEMMRERPAKLPPDPL